MLHEETIEASTLALIRRLMAGENLADFYLVGGMALSLKLGHRISIDIDLFIGEDFIDVYSLLEKLPMGMLVKAYADKYPQATPQIAKTSLLYHQDIDFSVPIKLLDRKFDWQQASMRLSQAVHRPGITFEDEQPQQSLKRGRRPKL